MVSYLYIERRVTDPARHIWAQGTDETPSETPASPGGDVSEKTKNAVQPKEEIKQGAKCIEARLRGPGLLFESTVLPFCGVTPHAG